jgi:hypothetical protein
MKPRVTLSVSGLSPVPLLTAGTELVLGLELVPELQPLANIVPAAVAPTVRRNFRLEKLAMSPYVRSMSMN